MDTGAQFTWRWSSRHFVRACVRAQIFALTRNKKRREDWIARTASSVCRVWLYTNNNKIFGPPTLSIPCLFNTWDRREQGITRGRRAGQVSGGTDQQPQFRNTQTHTQCHRKGGLTVEQRENKRAWRQFDIGGPQSGKSASPHLWRQNSLRKSLVLEGII